MTTVFDKNKKLINWKGETIKELTPSWQLNNNIHTSLDSKFYFKALPLKIYRNEIASNIPNCNSKLSIKIKNFETPKGTSVTDKMNGLDNITCLDKINTRCLEESCIPIQSEQQNALKRLRSNGIINNTKYYTNSQQYLNNRNLSYDKNNYQYKDLNSDFSYRSNNVTNCSNEVYYKPSNQRFAVQGAVSSSDLIARKKYNTITTVGDSYRTAFGNQTANALAYGVSDYGYTVKDKVGYPMKKTPTFTKYSNVMKICSVRKISNAI
jgi:hypothetical protein